MPIYSKNRPAYANEGAITKSYGANDAGIILYESCVNDGILFDAIVNHDRNEINAIKEGTILESEIKALNEEASETIFQKLHSRLDALWQKIKKLCSDIGNKIAAYIFGSGKAFAKDFRDTRDAYEKSGKKASRVSLTVPDFKFNVSIKYDEAYRSFASKEDKPDKAAIIAHDLAECVGHGGTLTPKQFNSYIDEKAFKTQSNVSPNDDIVDEMLSYVESAKESIKAIKETEKKAEEEIKKAKSDVKEKAKENKDKTNMLLDLGLLTTKEQTIGIATNASLRLVKNNVSCCRKALGVIKASMKKSSYVDYDTKSIAAPTNESYIFDAIVEATIEIDDAFDSDVKVTPELESFINSVNNEIALEC